MEGARRILVIRLGAVGDVVRTLPALPLLRRHHPEARLSWVAEEGPSALLAGHPDLDEIIVLPRRALAGLLSSATTLPSALALSWRFARELRARRFGVAVDFHGTLKSGLVSLASGASIRYGFSPPDSKEGNRFFSNRLVPLPPGPLHRVERTLVMVRALGAPAGEVHVRLPIGPVHRERVDRWLSSGGKGPRVLVYPGTSERQAYKRYPPGLLAAVAGRLASEGAEVIVAGGPGEEALAAQVVSAAPRLIRAAPLLGLLELAELIRRCDLFLGPDTGPMHIAWAVGTRVVALFGPTDPALNAPWGEGHIVLYNGSSCQRSGPPPWPDPEEVCASVRVALRMSTQHPSNTESPR